MVWVGDIIAVALIGTSAVVLAWRPAQAIAEALAGLRTAREQPRPEIAEYGDVIEVPAAAMNAGGRRQIRSDGLRTKDEIAPHQIGASK